MENEKPGCPPPDTPKPKINETNRPSFSYFDISFEDAFTSDGKKFVSYFVNCKNPYYIQMLRMDFEDYQRTFWDKLDYQVENDLCTCDNCTPDFELIDKVVVELYEKADEERVVKEQVFPVYAIFNMSNYFKIGYNGCHLK